MGGGGGLALVCVRGGVAVLGVGEDAQTVHEVDV